MRVQPRRQQQQGEKELGAAGRRGKKTLGKGGWKPPRSSCPRPTPPPRRPARSPAGTGPPPPPPPAAAAASSHGTRIRAGPRRATGLGHRERTIKTFYIFIAAGLAGRGGARAGDLDGRAGGGRGGARGGGEHNAGGWRGRSGPQCPDTRAVPPGFGAGVGSGWGTLLATESARGWRPARDRAGVRVGPSPGVMAPTPRPRPARAPGGGLTPAGPRLWLGAAWHGPGEVAFGF
ncbi:hypothetical protein ACRRTK_004706 [Alexandromys fortis]